VGSAEVVTITGNVRGPSPAQGYNRSYPMKMMISGGGGGGRHSMAGGKAGADAPAAEPAPAPPPMSRPAVTTQPPTTPLARKESRGEKSEEERDESAQTRRHPRLVIAQVVPSNLGDTRSLIGALESHLAACSDSGEVKLRLTIDASGRVIKVDVLSG